MLLTRILVVVVVGNEVAESENKESEDENEEGDEFRSKERRMQKW